MNERQKILSVFNGIKTDKKPWFADLWYLYDSMQIRGMLDEKYKGDEGYLEFYKDMGAGICFYPPFPWKYRYEGGIEYCEEQDGYTRTSIYRTPKGNIRSIQKYSPQTYTWAYTEHFVKNLDDLKTMLYIFENTRYSQNYDEFQKIDLLWGDYGIATAIPPISVSPIQKLLARWAGVQSTIEIYMDYEEEFSEILGRIQDSEDEVFNIISSSPSIYVEFAENLSSEVTGKVFFEKFNSPCYTKRIKQLHESGKFVGIHIDGTLKPCLPMLGQCGFDVAEAVTPFPVGDIKVEDLRKAAGDDIIIWGVLPGALFSTQYSDEEFEGHLKKVLHVFRDDDKFVLGVADQVPADGLISRVKKVREILESKSSWE